MERERQTDRDRDRQGQGQGDRERRRDRDRERQRQRDSADVTRVTDTTITDTTSITDTTTTTFTLPPLTPSLSLSPGISVPASTSSGDTSTLNKSNRWNELLSNNGNTCRHKRSLFRGNFCIFICASAKLVANSQRQKPPEDILNIKCSQHSPVKTLNIQLHKHPQQLIHSTAETPSMADPLTLNCRNALNSKYTQHSTVETSSIEKTPNTQLQKYPQ